ncbi:hypothetical protein AYO38_05070 [bacterium SCGC AG-212-C10]|nr:hypothetical protein AYO38_05070 [bacterium SCGC AG-212-C10]
MAANPPTRLILQIAAVDGLVLLLGVIAFLLGWPIVPWVCFGLSAVVTPMAIIAVTRGTRSG